MSSSEKKSAILTQLSNCIPRIQTMNEFGELLVQCLSQEANELYIPSISNIKELSNGLKEMRNNGIDFSDPKVVKVLLYGTKANKKRLNIVPGYDTVVYALDKIIAGPKIPSHELEGFEIETAKEMHNLL